MHMLFAVDLMLKPQVNNVYVLLIMAVYCFYLNIDQYAAIFHLLFSVA